MATCAAFSAIELMRLFARIEATAMDVVMTGLAVTFCADELAHPSDDLVVATCARHRIVGSGQRKALGMHRGAKPMWQKPIGVMAFGALLHGASFTELASMTVGVTTATVRRCARQEPLRPVGSLVARVAGEIDVRRSQQESRRAMLLGTHATFGKASIAVEVTLGATIGRADLIGCCQHHGFGVRALVTRSAGRQPRRLPLPQWGPFGIAVTARACGLRVLAMQRKAELPMFCCRWARTVPTIRLVTARTIISFRQVQRCGSRHRLLVRIAVALATTANGQVFALLTLDVAVTAWLMAGSARRLAMRADQCKPIVREPRDFLERSRLAVAGDARRTIGALMHVIVATRACLRRPQVSATGRRRDVVGMNMAPHAGQLRVRAVQCKRHVSVVVAGDIEDAGAFECMRRQQRRFGPVMLWVAGCTRRQRKCCMQTRLSSCLSGNRDMAVEAGLRRNRAITMAAGAIRAPLQRGDRRVRRMQEARPRIRTRQIPPGESHHQQQRDHRNDPTCKLHLPAAPSSRPKSTSPKRTADTICTTVKVSSSTASQRCIHRHVDNRPRKSS